MTRRASGAAAVIAATLLATTLAGCGEESTSAAADPESTPATSATPASPASPTPTAESQPRGAHGVTFQIVNWDDYADDPVVNAWKKTIEAFYGSVNAREPNEEFLRRTAGDQRRMWVGNINYARERDLVGPAVMKGRVVSVEVVGRKATLVGCDLRQTTNFRPRGEKYTDGERGFHKMTNTFVRRGKGADQRWVMTDSEPGGRCAKGAKR